MTAVSDETDLKRNEVLSFDDGLLTIKISGHGAGDGWGSIAFHERQIEIDADGFHVAEIPPSELRALRDFLNRVIPAALSAAPVAQEPVARLCGYCKTWNSKPCGEQCYLQPNDPVWTSPPATPAGTPANRGDRVIYWLKRYQADEHLDDDACEELDALINVLSKGVKVQPSAGVGADEIARAISAPLWLRPVDGDTYEIAGIDVATNAILALLSRAGDQSNSTHEEQSKQNI